MAEINKLSVGQALDKLRRPDVQSKQARLHEKMNALDEDIQRMRATRRRLEQDQRASEATTASDTQAMNARPRNKKRSFLILAVLAVVGPVLLVLIILYATLIR